MDRAKGWGFLRWMHDKRRFFASENFQKFRLPLDTSLQFWQISVAPRQFQKFLENKSPLDTFERFSQMKLPPDTKMPPYVRNPAKPLLAVILHHTYCRRKKVQKNVLCSAKDKKWSKLAINYTLAVKKSLSVLSTWINGRKKAPHTQKQESKPTRNKQTQVPQIRVY